MVVTTIMMMRTRGIRMDVLAVMAGKKRLDIDSAIVAAIMHIETDNRSHIPHYKQRGKKLHYEAFSKHRSKYIKYFPYSKPPSSAILHARTVYDSIAASKKPT